MAAKKEIATCREKDCCNIAVLSGIIHTAGAISVSKEGISVIIASENEGIFEIAESTVKKLFGKPCTVEKGRLIIKGDFIVDLLLDLGILEIREELTLNEGINRYIVAEDCCKQAYLAGAFLGGGFIYVKQGYHLEFCCNSRILRDEIIKLLQHFELRAAKSMRKGRFIAYIKDKDSVSDCLALMGAQMAVLELNSMMAERSLIQFAVRRANCDVANTDKLVKTSLEQCRAISALGRIENKILKETAEARLEWPEYSYEELAGHLGISKGAVKYRLNKLMAMERKEK